MNLEHSRATPSCLGSALWQVGGQCCLCAITPDRLAKGRATLWPNSSLTFLVAFPSLLKPCYLVSPSNSGAS